jgi:hypothetical protein
MQRVLAAVLAAVLVLGPVSAQTPSVTDLLKRATGQQAAPLSQREVETGLKEALTLGAETTALRLGALDGFFADGKVRIPLPGRLGQAQKRLKPLGLSGPLDDLELRVNRAAEAAMPQAKTLVVDAVKSLTIQDAMTILRGGNDAATKFLRSKTETRLTETLRPLMTTALTESGAFAAADSAARRSGLGRYARSTRDDIATFATRKALDGVFYYLAQEEAAIRTDPAKRVTAVLARVFGAAR